MSGFLGAAAGWRWIEGLMAIFTGVLWIVCSLLIPETYAPVLLRTRAAKLSKLTGKVYLSKMDIGKERITVWRRLRISLSRPWKLLFREPIVFLVSVYMAIVYGTLYMMFPAFPIIFQLNKGWSAGISGLAFLGITVGMIWAVCYALFDNKRYTAMSEKHNGDVPPEARLPGAIIGSILLPIGLFWFAWTDGNNVHWIVPIIGSMFFATGLVLVFLSLLNYLIDACESTTLPPSPPLNILCKQWPDKRAPPPKTPRRCIRRLGPSRQRRPAVTLRRRLPPVHRPDVREPGHTLGCVGAGVPGADMHPVPHRVLQVRAPDPRAVQVRRRGRAGARGDAR